MKNEIKIDGLGFGFITGFVAGLAFTVTLMNWTISLLK